MLGIIGRFWWVLLLVGGALVVFLFRDFIGGNASDLKVGDCFDVPTETIVEDVQHHPCNESHTGEVFLVVDHPAEAGAPFPNDEDLGDFFVDRCLSAFESYTGVAYEDAVDLEVDAFYPLDEGWGDGQRTFICYAFRADEGPMTESVRASDG